MTITDHICLLGLVGNPTKQIGLPDTMKFSVPKVLSVGTTGALLQQKGLPDAEQAVDADMFFLVVAQRLQSSKT